MQQYVELGRAALSPVRNDIQRSKAERELNKAVSSSHETIMTATTVFPLKLFPDTITIDRTKFNITHRTFFWAAEVISINLEDILNVTASVAFFFGSIQIHTRFFDPHRPYKVSMLWREDALRIDRIMLGYGVAIRENIDLSTMSAAELADKLDELGKGAACAQV